MRTTLYILISLFAVLFCRAQELSSDYRGMIYVKENCVEQQGDNLLLDLQIDLSGLPVGRYQSLALVPMLRDGRDSLMLQPIVVNGANKQKMYERTLAFKGKTVADEGAYLVGGDLYVYVLEGVVLAVVEVEVAALYYRALAFGGGGVVNSLAHIYSPALSFS